MNLMTYEISVVIVQYNPSWENLMLTMQSVLQQKDCRYEIVIADDGSKEKLFEKTEQYLRDNHFTEYKLVDNKENQGTVKNILSGLYAATGKYVRVIAPGDCLYSENTLSHIVAFMKQNNAKEMFGKLAGYRYENGKLEAFKYLAPSQTALYKAGTNRDAILKSLLEYGDNISGASYSFEREYYTYLLKKIEGKVIFLEDCVNAYTIFEGNKIYFMDEYVTWYELGTGVTTGGNRKWVERIAKDWAAFFEQMQKDYPSSKSIQRAKRLHELEASEKKCDKLLLRATYLDKFISIKMSRIMDKRNEKDFPELEHLSYIHSCK